MNDRKEKTSAFHLTDFFNLNGYYWHTRNWRRFKQGIPAMLVGAMVLVPAMAYPLTKKRSAKRYQVAFNEAVRQQNYETANLFLKKLEALGSGELDQEQLKFNQAMTLYAQNYQPEAIAMMKENWARSEAVVVMPAARPRRSSMAFRMT